MERIDPSHQPLVPRRVLLVIRRRLIAEGLEALFCQYLRWQVRRAETVQEAVELIGRWVPEIAIVDLSLPDGGAFHLLECFRSPPYKIRVVFLDETVQQTRLLAVQRLQVPGYFTLQDSFECMAAGLREILAGKIVYTAGAEVFLTRPAESAASSKAPAQPLPQEQTKQPPSALGCLSRREMEVLIHLARGLTVKECAKLMHLSPHTVDNHKARLMSKLGIHRSVDLIRLALREKLIEQ